MEINKLESEEDAGEFLKLMKYIEKCGITAEENPCQDIPDVSYHEF